MNQRKEELITSYEEEYGRTIPRRYVPYNLSMADLKKQLESIFKHEPRPFLKSFKAKRSKYTILAEKYFGKGNTSKQSIAEKLSDGDKKREDELMAGFDIIYDRGMKAYETSGSRPNQTPFSWGDARVKSVLFNGKARQQDNDVVEKYSIPDLTKKIKPSV